MALAQPGLLSLCQATPVLSTASISYLKKSTQRKHYLRWVLF